jgi:APA family basic amino acid/polyamine antiporter
LGLIDATSLSSWFDDWFWYFLLLLLLWLVISVLQLLIIWLVTGLITVAAALSYGELAGMMQRQAVNLFTFSVHTED